MSTSIDAAIIKTLVEHVGGDSSCIPDGTIGGVSYTAGDGINIANNNISVEYDSSTMELKNGKISAKTQLTTGDGLTTSNGKIIANLDTNTMQMNSGKISAKTQLAAGNGISISSGKVNVNYDSNTMELKNGKLAAKSSGTTYTGSKNIDITSNVISLKDPLSVDIITTKNDKGFLEFENIGEIFIRRQNGSTINLVETIDDLLQQLM